MFPKARLLNKTTGFAGEKTKINISSGKGVKGKTRKTITFFSLLEIALPCFSTDSTLYRDN